jgi:hypothetical protein
MAQSWYYHFKFSMSSVGLPAPESIFGSCAQATAAAAAMVKALQTVGSGAAKAMTLRALLAEAAGGASLGETLGAASAGELLAISGGVLASFYVGACVGAAIYATQQKASDWLDEVFTQKQASTNAQQMKTKVERMGFDIPQDPPWSISTPGTDGDTDQMCKVPANSCTDDSLSDVNYCSGWPSKPAN